MTSQPPYGPGHPPQAGGSRTTRNVLIGLAVVLAVLLVALIGWIVLDSRSTATATETATPPAVDVDLPVVTDPLDNSGATTTDNGPTTRTELCAAYDAAAAVTVRNGGTEPAAINPALRELAAAARAYPDAQVQSDAPRLEQVTISGYSYPRHFYGATLNISEVCE